MVENPKPVPAPHKAQVATLDAPIAVEKEPAEHWMHADKDDAPVTTL